VGPLTHLIEMCYIIIALQRGRSSELGRLQLGHQTAKPSGGPEQIIAQDLLFFLGPRPVPARAPASDRYLGPAPSEATGRTTTLTS